MKKLILFLYLLVSTHAQEFNCGNKANTYVIMDCQKLEIEASKKMLHKYFDRSLERYSEDKK